MITSQPINDTTLVVPLTDNRALELLVNSPLYNQATMATLDKTSTWEGLS